MADPVLYLHKNIFSFFFVGLSGFLAALFYALLKNRDIYQLIPLFSVVWYVIALCSSFLKVYFYSFSSLEQRIQADADLFNLNMMTFIGVLMVVSVVFVVVDVFLLRPRSNRVAKYLLGLWLVVFSPGLYRMVDSYLTLGSIVRDAIEEYDSNN